MQNFLKCGKITGTHGIKGGLKIANYSDFNRFEKGKFIYLKLNNEFIKFKINSVKDYKNGFIIDFDNLLDINLVEKYVNSDIYALKEVNDLADNEYYYNDLINKKLYFEDGEYISTVCAIREFPQSHMLEFYIDDKLKYIPFDSHFVKDVLEDKIIIFKIEGLI